MHREFRTHDKVKGLNVTYMKTRRKCELNCGDTTSCIAAVEGTKWRLLTLVVSDEWNQRGLLLVFIDFEMKSLGLIVTLR